MCLVTGCVVFSEIPATCYVWFLLFSGPRRISGKKNALRTPMPIPVALALSLLHWSCAHPKSPGWHQNSHQDDCHQDQWYFTHGTEGLGRQTRTVASPWGTGTKEVGWGRCSGKEGPRWPWLLLPPPSSPSSLTGILVPRTKGSHSGPCVPLARDWIPSSILFGPPSISRMCSSVGVHPIYL